MKEEEHLSIEEALTSLQCSLDDVQEIKEGREKRLEDVKAEIRATEGLSFLNKRLCAFLEGPTNPLRERCGRGRHSGGSCYFSIPLTAKAVEPADVVVDYLCFTRRPEDFSESETESREACFDLAITGSGAGLAHRNVVEVAVVRINFIASSPLAVHGASTTYTYGAPTWIFSAVYASTDYRERIDFWAKIDDMVGMGMPMLVMGDFHCILDATEKRGGLPHLLR